MMNELILGLIYGKNNSILVLKYNLLKIHDDIFDDIFVNVDIEESVGGINFRLYQSTISINNI